MTYGDGQGRLAVAGPRPVPGAVARGATSYPATYAAAPANRKDIFEGTVNVHWKAGLKLRGKPGDAGFAARAGRHRRLPRRQRRPSTTSRSAAWSTSGPPTRMKFYEQQQALPTDYALQNLHMRQQIFTHHRGRHRRPARSRSTSRWSSTCRSTPPPTARPPIDGTVYDSKASPLVDPVVGVGFENFAFTQDDARPRPRPTRCTTTATWPRPTRCTASCSSGRPTRGCAASARDDRLAPDRHRGGQEPPDRRQPARRLVEQGQGRQRLLPRLPGLGLALRRQHHRATCATSRSSGRPRATW